MTMTWWNNFFCVWTMQSATMICQMTEKRKFGHIWWQKLTILTSVLLPIILLMQPLDSMPKSEKQVRTLYHQIRTLFHYAGPFYWTGSFFIKIGPFFIYTGPLLNDKGPFLNDKAPFLNDKGPFVNDKGLTHWIQHLDWMIAYLTFSSSQDPDLLNTLPWLIQSWCISYKK